MDTGKGEQPPLRESYGEVQQTIAVLLCMLVECLIPKSLFKGLTN